MKTLDHVAHNGKDAPSFDETPPGKRLDGGARSPWKIIISDHDEEVHRAVRKTLKNYMFDNRGLMFISGYSPGEAVGLMETHPDAALLLVNGVTETDDAGLETVRRIREEMNNASVRVILIADREGDAPENKRISEYEIDDFTSRAELASGALSIRISSCLRAHRRSKALMRLNGELSREISRRKRVEEDLEEVERELSTLKKNLPGVAYRCKNDDNRTLEFLSEGCLRLTGYDASDLLGNRALSFGDLILPKDKRSVRNRIQDAIWEKRSFKLAYRIRTAGGETKWVWEQGSIVFSDSGEPLALEGYLSDVDEHMETEQALRKENARLRLSMGDRHRLGDIVGKCAAMQDVYDLIIKASATSANVIVYGEAGTGKKLVAGAIHKMSDRGSRPFVSVNCADFSESEIEGKLFGYEKGTGADADGNEPGDLDKADGGSLYLDQIGALDLNMQIKLLRLIEGGGFTPPGASVVKKPDIRFITGADRNLADHVRKGRMREDFFYRIHIIPINLPPLRERKEDMRLLVDHFLGKFNVGDKKPLVMGKIRKLFREYRWPGNVSELQKVLYRYFTRGEFELMGEAAPLAAEKDNAPMSEPTSGPEDLRTAIAAFEKRTILEALTEHRWHKGNVTEILGIDRKTLAKKIKAHGLEKP